MSSLNPTAVRVPIDRLLAIEANLDRSFTMTVVIVILGMAWPVVLLVLELDRKPWVLASIFAWMAAAFVAYVWFAYAAMVAAAEVERSRWMVGAWILLAPVVGAFLPIPFVGKMIQISPLSLKFILASELRSEIHDRTFSE